MTLSESILEYLSEKGLINLATVTFYDRLIIFAIVISICFAIYITIEKLIKPTLLKMTTQTSTKWDDHLFNEKMLKSINLLTVSIILHLLMPIATAGALSATVILGKCCQLLILISCIHLTNTFIASFHKISNETNSAKTKTINGFFQVLKGIVIIVGIILGVSILFDRSIGSILAAIGASAAILSLVFKDTILSFVAGVQINIYDTLRPGDWIIMNSKNVNGEVIDINLNIVRVLNWDNSIATIPAHLFLTETVQNYRQMRDDKSRRLSKKIFIDINSIKKVENNDIARFRKLTTLTEKDTEGKEFSNLFYYREYLKKHYENLCKKNPKLETTHHQMMIKTLEPTNYGLPIELYFFTTITDWESFEDFNSEIMEFAFSSMEIFGLKPFQSPSGNDLSKIIANN